MYEHAYLVRMQLLRIGIWLTQDYHDEFAFRYSHRHEKAGLIELVLQSC